ncbi:MAG: 50S ribosomal protein L10 [Phycisphaerae bacterium]|nr:50S ribosomal protein L10 [Phycisphaerae bacterium]
MSKQVKQLICDELVQKFRDVDACMVVDLTPLDGLTANALRGEMAKANIRMMMVKNSLAKRALADLPLAPVGGLLDGACALAWGGDSIVDIAKLLVDKAKTLPLTIKGAVLEGQALDAAAATGLSKLPNRAELMSMVSGQVLSPGAKLAAAVLGPGAAIASIIKGRIESLEKSEPAAA